MIFKILKFVGKVNTAIILTLIWLVIILPLSILNKIFTKDSHKFSWNRNQSSSWIQKNHLYKKEDLKNEW